jgi:hypothetical protein
MWASTQDNLAMALAHIGEHQGDSRFAEEGDTRPPS